MTFTFVTSYFEKACKFCRAKLSNQPNNIGDEATKTVVSPMFVIMTPPYTAISRKVVGKKKTKVYATRPKGGLGIHWNFAYWPEEIYKFVFLHVENLFFLSGAYICSFTFTVACL